MIILFYKQIFTRSLVDSPKLNSVLSGFTLHLASHFGKSCSNHSDSYDISNDLPNCFASHTVNPGSLANYWG